MVFDASSQNDAPVVGDTHAEYLLFEIKGNPLDDGPGIRTVIFFKGCPLSCVWCHNPEGKLRSAELSFDAKKCISCDTCIDVCPEKALGHDYPLFIDRQRCTLCRACVDPCPSGALTVVGRSMTIDEIMRDLEKDIPFFRNSGGGVTLSGGEPTLLIDFVGRLSERLKMSRVHVLLETCGLFNYRAFIDRIYPNLDMIYFDIKILDNNAHQRFCGCPNDMILENFRCLLRRYQEGGVEILPRVPLIPGYTASDENLSAIATFLGELGVPRLALVQNNPLWLEKNGMLGRAVDVNGEMMQTWIDQKRMNQIRSLFKDFEVL